MSRPNIPESIKKEVRKKCYYGCVICGNPITEYEHIEEWHKVKKHEVENLTLLCSSHHAEVTKKMIDKEYIREKTLDPFNKNRAETPNHHIYFRGNEFKVVIGTTIFEEENFTNEERVIIKIANKPIVTAKFENNNLLISMTFFDNNDIAVFKIVDNELILSTEGYDIKNITNRFIITKYERVIFEFEVSPPKKLIISKMNMIYRGRHILVEGGAIKYSGVSIIGGKNSYNGEAAINMN